MQLIGALLLFSGFVFVAAAAQVHRTEALLELKCAGSQLQFQPGMITIMENCRNQTIAAWIAAKKTEKPAKKQRACQGLCYLKDLGLMDANGNMLKDGVATLIDQIFPEAKTADLKKELDACIDQFGTGLTNKAGDCTSMIDLVRCSAGKLFQICEISPPAFLHQHTDEAD